MQVKVKVIAHASKCEVIPLNTEQTELKVKLTAPALENRANRQLCEVLADYFKVSKRQVRLLSGEHNTHKYVEIALEN